MLRGRLLIVGVGIVMLAGSAPAAAATITVNTTNDDQVQGDGNCSLRKAIQDVDSPGSSQTDCAPAAFGANTIVLGKGSYLLGSGGPLTVASTVAKLTITGQGEQNTFIDARLSGNRVFTISGGATVTIQGLTVANGHAPDGASGTPGSGAAGQPGASGGGILNQGNLSLIDSAITGSQAGAGGAGGSGGSGGAGSPGGTGGAGGPAGSGGAIYNTGNLSLVGVTIGSDDAGSGGAGGPGGQGTTGGVGGNGGAGGDGGGVTNAGGAVSVVDSTFRSDGAGNGGPGGGGGSGSATTGGAGGNGGAGGGGGGIAADGGALSVTNSTFASNTAGSSGIGGNGGAAPSSGAGAVGGDGGAGGAAGSGGGIVGANPSSASALQITVAGNNPGSPGTGGSGGSGATVGAAGANGAPGAGGGVFDAGSSITLQNSLLALNGGNCGGAILDGGHNLAFGDSSCPSTFASGDPNLGALQNNGGPAPTISLQPGSAAIDQIPPSGANCPQTDERGVRRPSGPKCDIGAYEVTPPAVKTGAATGVNKTYATLHATVTPNSGVVGVTFQYGRTPKLGLQSPVLSESGLAPVAIAIRVLQLRPNTTYYYRVWAASLDGGSYGAILRFTTATPALITRLSIAPRSFRAGKGATISYTDSLPGKTQFVVLRCVTQKQGKCVRTKRSGAFTHVDKKGRNRFKWNGRVGRTTLARGNYVVQATPQSPRVGPTATARFTVT